MEKSDCWNESIIREAYNLIWKNRSQEIKKARELIEFNFGIPLTLGDRMVLRRCVFESIEDFGRNFSAVDSFNPYREGAARFLHRHLGILLNESWKRLNTAVPYFADFE